jgi:hypothetical protein
LHDTIYNQYEKRDYHIINIKDVEWDAFPKCSNNPSTFSNLKSKEVTFALFVRITRSWWVREKRNYIQMSFANTYVKSTFYITFNDSKFLKEYKNKTLQWNQYWVEKYTYLIWHDNRGMNTRSSTHFMILVKKNVK